MTRAQPIYRAATPDDLDALLELRLVMFEAMGTAGPKLDAAIEPMRAYFAEHLPTGSFRAWIAEVEGVPIASIGLVIHHTPPSPYNPVGKGAYLMNLVTLPTHRGQGIARKLIQIVLDVVRNEGIAKVSLHASPKGQGLYESFGFRLHSHNQDGNPIMELTFQDSNNN